MLSIKHSILNQNIHFNIFFNYNYKKFFFKVEKVDYENFYIFITQNISIVDFKKKFLEKIFTHI